MVGVEMKNITMEDNNSITLDLTSNTGVDRKLNIYTFHVTNELPGSMSITILDSDKKLLGNVVLDRNDIRILLEKIGQLI
jgi:hypothetical protein